MNDRDLADLEVAASILRRMIAGGDSGGADREALARRIYVLASRVYGGGGAERPVIVRARQTCFGCPTQWDAWDDSGNYWYLRFRFGYGSAESAGTPERWDSAGAATRELFFRDDDDMAGVISLEEFCERAGLELRLA